MEKNTVEKYLMVIGKQIAYGLIFLYSSISSKGIYIHKNKVEIDPLPEKM